MIEKKIKPNELKSSKNSNSNDKTAKNDMDVYQDYFTSFYDGILVQETLRRKKLGLSFSQKEAHVFLNKVRHGIVEAGISLSGSQDYEESNYPLIDKAAKENKHTAIKLMKKTAIDDSISEWLKKVSLALKTSSI